MSDYTDYYAGLEDTGNSTGRSIGGALTGAGSGALGGAAAGSVIPGIGTGIGAIIGGASGLLGGLFSSQPSKEDQLTIQQKALQLEELRQMMNAQHIMNVRANNPSAQTTGMLHPVTGMQRATPAQLFPGRGGPAPQGTIFDTMPQGQNMAPFFAQSRGIPMAHPAPSQPAAAQPAEPGPYSAPYTPPVQRAVGADDQSALEALRGMRRR